MNLFRGRRSSTGGSASAASAAPIGHQPDLEQDQDASNSLLSGARSSLCRVFMPRSRTSTSCNLASNSASTASNSSQYSNYFDQKSVGTTENYCRRTASLSRNLTRRSRSVTMPNIEQQSYGQPTTLSTFKARRHFALANT